MRRTFAWIAAIAAVAVAIALLYGWIRKGVPVAQSPTPPAAEVVPKPEVGAGPQILHPVPQDTPPEHKPLPSLNDSDVVLREAFVGLVGGSSLAEIVLFSDLIRRIVATVDSLPRRIAPQRLLPVKNVGGPILVSSGPEGTHLMPQNSARYAAYVRLGEAVDTAQLIAFYVRFYPLFQQAYQELGYPKGYFNDRLVAVIDDLLAAPEAREPLRLVQPKVMYEFADPELEAHSAGQKILIRMGAENAARVKAKLRDIRNALIGLGARRPN